MSKLSPEQGHAALQNAVALHQQGQLAAAEKGYTRVLKSFPDQFDALHLLGLLKLQSGKAGEAQRLITSALKIAPNAPDAHANMGLVLGALKRAADALASFDRALALAPDHFEAQANRDALIETSGALKVVAASLTKIANDIRWMGSGPRAGLGELILPELQKGSSIMPGKVNPVICEVVTQVAAQVIGNDAAITIGGMSGAFELNVYIPLMARNLLESIGLLAAASRLLARKLVDGVQADIERNEQHGEATLAMATALNPFIGYDRATAIVRDATSSGRSLREVARAHGVDESVLDEALDLRKIARGNTG